MLTKRTLLGLTGCVLLTLAACSNAPATPRVAVTLTGTTEAVFVSTEPLVYAHVRPDTSAKIVSQIGDRS